MKYYNLFALVFMFVFAPALYGQVSEYHKGEDIDVYISPNQYEVVQPSFQYSGERPKNIILLIGDGMGTTQVFAGLTANKGQLNMTQFKVIGFSKTQAADDYITDSGAGGTAIATGKRTYNGAIGMSMVDGEAVAQTSLLEIAEQIGMETGLVATSSITHATPASFIAHQKHRALNEAIAADFLKTDIEVFIGGGYNYFAERKRDDQDLILALKKKGYTVVNGNIDEVYQGKGKPFAGFLAAKHPAKSFERERSLIKSAQKALEILETSTTGYFLMIEGSQIDWGGHAKDLKYVVEEVLEFDETVGECIKVADRTGETLIIVTADHETGGMAITGGDMEKGEIKGGFISNKHTPVMVPVFSYGPGSEYFNGVMNNTDIFERIKALMEEK